MTEELFSQLVVIARDALETRNKEKFEDILDQLKSIDNLDDYQLKILNELLDEYNEGIELNLYAEPGEEGAEDELLQIATDGEGIDVDKYRIFEDEEADFEGFSVPAARDLNLAMKDDDEQMISAYSEHDHSAVDTLFESQDIAPVEESDVDDEFMIKEPEPMQFEIADDDEPVDEEEPEYEPTVEEIVDIEPEVIMDDEPIIETEPVEIDADLKHSGTPAGLRNFEPVLDSNVGQHQKNVHVFATSIPLKAPSDYDLFSHKAKMYLLELCSAFVLALHPWKLLFGLIGTAIICLLSLFVINLYNATEPIIQNTSLLVNDFMFFGSIALSWIVFWSIPVTISHMTRAQLEKRFVPNIFRSIKYVYGHFSVSIVWPLLIVGIFGGILYALVNLSNFPTDLSSANTAMITAAYGQYLLMFLAILILGAFLIGIYLPPAMIGLGRSRRMSRLTVKFFKLYVFRFPRILIYTIFLMLLTISSFALFGLVNYFALALINFMHTGEFLWGEALPVANDVLAKTTEWVPYLNEFYGFFNMNIQTMSDITAGTIIVSSLVLFVLAFLVSYALSVFFTGGTLVYAALRTVARND
ncbi:MAG: hypothetical protein K8S87_11165 [Planctomycetes bacterium]|nr:hypothetical protein [Planctomycetota bacterium]